MLVESNIMPGGLEAGTMTRREVMLMERHAAGYLAHGISIRAGDSVFDVGANIGVFALSIHQLTHGHATIFAFEPAPPTFDVLVRNLERADSENLRVFPFGLSNKQETVELTYYPRSPTISTAHPELWRDGELGRALLGNLSNGPLANWWTRRIPKALGKHMASRLTRDARTYLCEFRTLSSIIQEQGVERIDLLKVDVEGAEMDVLEGVADGDWFRISQVVLEVHDVEGRVDSVVHMLKSHGFNSVAVDRESGFELTNIFNVYARRS